MGEAHRLQVHYTDLAGFLRGVEVPYDSWPGRKGRFIASFDGSSVYGFLPIEGSDALLEPVEETLADIPWSRGVARVIARVYRPSGERLDRDPRFIAERALEYSRSLGYEPLMSAELEFFVVRGVRLGVDSPFRGVWVEFSALEQPWEGPGIHAPVKASYHYTSPGDRLLGYRERLAAYVKGLGFSVEASHHEVASSQVEASVGAGDPVYLGDEVVTVKWAARCLAGEMGLVAIFMPKPFYGDNGSGMHIHVSLWSPGRSRNLFVYEDEELGEEARHFIGGLIEHARSLAAIVAPTTNSYRRLVPGYEAPVYPVWGFRNRSAMVRVPANMGDPSRSRIEYRTPDPSSNPYLAAAATLLAGLDGVKKKMDPGDPYEGNVYKLGPAELRAMNIGTLPRSLDEALDELESDNSYLKPAFTGSAIDAYIDLKRAEAREVNSRPHPYEFYKYLPL